MMHLENDTTVPGRHIYGEAIYEWQALVLFRQYVASAYMNNYHHRANDPRSRLRLCHRRIRCLRPEIIFVHKEFACFASPVFDAAFNSNFIEGQTQTYKLDDTTSRAFRLLTQWLYFEKLKITCPRPSVVPTRQPAKKRARFSLSSSSKATASSQAYQGEGVHLEIHQAAHYYRHVVTCWLVCHP
jgi:hypothetical protein